MFVLKIQVRHVEIDWSDYPATIEAGETESKVKYETQI